MGRPRFAAADTYVRYYDFRAAAWRFIHLLQRQGPIIYPYRFSSLTPGSEQSQPTTFTDLSASAEESHVYQAFLGLWPWFWYKLWHPYNVRLLQTDERVTQVNEDIVSILRYEDSPHESPEIAVWVDESRYPAVQPRNIGRITATPKVEWTMMKFRATFHDDISAETKGKLQTGELPSTIITFGGEI